MDKKEEQEPIKEPVEAHIDSELKLLKKKKLEIEIKHLESSESSAWLKRYQNYKQLILLVVGFGLTSILGAYIADSIQDKTNEKQERARLELIEKQAATEIFRELSNLMDKRYFRTKQLFEGLQLQLPQQELQVLQTNYHESVNDWHENKNRLLTSCQRYFGYDDMEKLRSSISPNFHTLTILVEEYAKSKDLTNFQKNKIENLFGNIEVAVFNFNLTLITQIQDSKVGLFKLAEDPITESVGKYQYENPIQPYPKIKHALNISEDEVKLLVAYYGLNEIKVPNKQLSFSEGDIAFWQEQRLSEYDLNMEFLARRYVLDEADKNNTRISDQGELSWAANQVIDELKLKSPVPYPN